MRVLFTIPHFYRGVSDDARHGSESTRAREGRRAALDAAISHIHDLFGERRYAAVHQRKAMTAAPNPLALDFEIAICTTQGAHLLEELSVPSSYYRHVATDAEPKFLGWECHRLLGEAVGQFDYYCYLEDDIVIEDPFFFAKLELFNAYFRELAERPGPLLQPQRFEMGPLQGGVLPVVQRVYMDYQVQDLPIYAGDPVQIDHLGVAFTLEPTSHPHAGCFFLDDEQMRHLTRHPLFLNREQIWVTPLDTAATLAIGRAFRVYKPALDSMAFLEVRHAHSAVIQQLHSSPAGHPTWVF